VRDGRVGEKRRPSTESLLCESVGERPICKARTHDRPMQGPSGDVSPSRRNRFERVRSVVVGMEGLLRDPVKEVVAAARGIEDAPAG